MALWLRLYRLITRAARFEAADLRRPDAADTFARVCAAAATRGRAALAFTALRELLVIAGVIALAHLRRAPRLRLPRPGEGLRQLRFALRGLTTTHRGYAAMATLVMSVSLGVNLLVFTVVNALWLRPLPFPEPHRVVTITETRWSDLTKPALSIMGGGVAGQVDTTDYLAGVRPRIEIDGRTPEALGVTPNYFDVLWLPIRGRTFSADDDRDGAEPVAIISDRLWSGLFGRRADVIGAVVPARPWPIRIIGVAPRDFTGIRRGEQADLWIPTNLVRRLAPASESLGRLSLIAFGRLSPDQSVEMADERLWDLTDPQLRAFYQQLSIRMDRRPRVVPVAHVFGTPDTRTFMVTERDAALVVAGLALLVLFGGCATIAALVLVHYERRRTELAVKMSLGAGRARLMGELLGGLTLLALAGCAGAVIVAALGVKLLPAMSLPGGVEIGRLDLSIDWRVWLVGLSATLATLALAAALPLLRATRPTLSVELVAPSSSTSRASQRVRQGLLALQVCSTVVVLVAAGLFVRAVVHGFGNAPGFDVDRTVFVSIQERAPWNREETAGYQPQLIRARNARLAGALRALPGVEAVAQGLPPIGPADRFVIKTLKAKEREHAISVTQLRGSGDMLAVLGVPILSGRALTDADAMATPHPAVITQTLARRLWPDGDALGQPLRAPVSRYGPFTVVGIARDFPFGSLSEPGDGAVITAQPVMNGQVGFFVVRTTNPELIAGSIRRNIRGYVVNASTGREVVARDIGRQRLGAWFFSGFGLAALLLGVGGAFGLVAHLAEAQRREFGVRLALGADAGHLVRHGVAAALKPVAVGVAGGLVLAGLVAQVFGRLLAGVSALDTSTYAAVAITMIACATLAALSAAWRVRRLTPSDALRST